eukprot:scaffold298900_cov33-Tisochrysis_lutea.AAC.1
MEPGSLSGSVLRLRRRTRHLHFPPPFVQNSWSRIQSRGNVAAIQESTEWYDRNCDRRSCTPSMNLDPRRSLALVA